MKRTRNERRYAFKREIDGSERRRGKDGMNRERRGDVFFAEWVMG